MTIDASPGTRAAGPLLLVAVATALVTAAVQLTVMGVRRHLLGEFTWIWWSRDGAWFTPLAYLLLFAPLALVLLAAHLAWPRRVTLAAAAGAFAWLGAFSVLLLFTKITWWAWFIVAVGAGVQVARLAARAPGTYARTARWTAATLAAVFAIWGVANDRQQRGAERAALTALPPAAAGQPNVLLLILDTVRARSLSLYGLSQETTPRLTARAAEGAVFDAAYSTAPWTLPSHASIFTGRYSSSTSADWRSPLDTQPVTLAEALRARGYATGGFVANFIATGYRTGLGRGFIRYQDVKRTFEEVARNSTLMQSIGVVRALDRWQHDRWLGGAVRALLRLELQNPGNYLVHDTKTAPEVSAEFLGWQGSLPADRPFFAFLNYFDAHLPYVSPAPYRTMFTASNDDHAQYLGAIRYLDEQVDQLLVELERRGVLQNTIVVLTSDHGELFNENGVSRHGNSLYRNALHVPLVVLAPGRVPRATRIGRPVSLRDLGATILELVDGASAPAGVPALPGQSLASLMANPLLPGDSIVVGELNRGIGTDADTPPEVVTKRRSPGDAKAVLDDTLHVVVTSRGGVQAYAFRADSMESHDLVSDSASRAKYRDWAAARLQAAGARWKARPGETPPGAPAPPAGGDSARVASSAARQEDR